MDQNFNLGPGFFSYGPKAQNGLKFKNWTPPPVFELPKGQKFMEQIFDSGPGFRAVVLKVPKMA